MTEPEHSNWAELRQVYADRRRMLGYTQRKVAHAMGTTQSALSDLENGRTVNPGLDTLRRWADALHMKIALQLQFEEVVILARTTTVNLGD